MNEASGDLIALIFAIAAALFGRFSLRHPEKVSRFFTFGYGGDNESNLAFNKVQGWALLIVGIIGAIMFLVMIPIDLFSSK